MDKNYRTNIEQALFYFVLLFYFCSKNGGGEYKNGKRIGSDEVKNRTIEQTAKIVVL